MYRLPASLAGDITYFSTLVDEFNQGITEPVKFKGIRVPMGIYEQRKDGTYMIRIRCAGGYISPEQLETVTQIAKDHQSDVLHITTRQEIQIHNISIDQVKTILPRLTETGLSSKGGGGNTVRNIIADVETGISKDETFDVLPYVSGLTTALIAEQDSFSLPRKFKIAFSSSAKRPGYALVNDLGFVAKIRDGKKGFGFYLGGSLASNPTLGWEIFDFFPEEELLNVTRATRLFFSRHGNRKNKHKARIRYIFYKEGFEKVKAWLLEYYEEVKRNENNVFIPPVLPFVYKVPGVAPVVADDLAYLLWKKRYVRTQGQPGFSAVIIPFCNGNSKVEILRAIAAFAGQFGNDTIRFTTRQQIQLRNIPDAYLGNLYLLLGELNLEIAVPAVINDVVSCTGADTCRLGICLSKGTANALKRRLSKAGFDPDDAAGLQINMSGCPNSCAQQLWADIGFSGRVGRNDRMYPAYNVFVGAVKGTGARLADNLGVVSARDLPEFTTELIGDYILHKGEVTTFREYVFGSGREKIRELFDKYAEIPGFEEDKNYYYDWGSDELFSVSGKGIAECSAGLFDMIEVDQSTIRDNIQNLQKTDDPAVKDELLRKILFSASRMLLVTRGAEPRSDSETYRSFITKFIDAGLIDESFRKIVELGLKEQKAGLTTHSTEIIKLANAVIALYEGMDDSLQFKITEKISPELPDPERQPEEKTVRDLRGVACPFNFVKTKIELSKLQAGDLLEIWLDDGQPVQNVPGSVRNEGHEVVSLIQKDDFWQVLIRKV